MSNSATAQQLFASINPRDLIRKKYMNALAARGHDISEFDSLFAEFDSLEKGRAKTCEFVIADFSCV